MINLGKLKNCPFCGGAAAYTPVLSSARGSIRGWEFCIKCTKCGVSTPKNYKVESQINGAGELITVVDKRYDAMEDWNQRADGSDYDKEFWGTEESHE